MSKSKKIEDLKAAVDESEQLRDLLDTVNHSQDLPSSGTELILLEVDPHRAHAYWNIATTEAQSGKPLVLRVYDITESGNPERAQQAFDVEVHGLQGRWYLDFWRDDRTFVSEIGYRMADGSLGVLARSNEVSTPPAAPVDVEVVGTHTDHNGKPLLTEWPGDRAPAEEASEAVPAEEEPKENEPVVTESPEESVPPPVVANEPVTILDPEFPVADWNKPFADVPLISDDVKDEDTVIAAGDASVAFDDAVMDTDEEEGEEAVPGADDSPEEEHFPSAEELAASINEDNAALQAFYEAAGPEVHHEEIGAEPSPNDGDGYPETTSPQEGEGQVALPPLEQVVGLSSMENAQKDVLLEVNAELHIYGRAKPNTELTLYGQVVRTRPDGTFSVRRILPHGAVVLPLLYTRNED